jgi:hypothetical protein
MCVISNYMPHYKREYAFVVGREIIIIIIITIIVIIIPSKYLYLTVAT